MLRSVVRFLYWWFNHQIILIVQVLLVFKVFLDGFLKGREDRKEFFGVVGLEISTSHMLVKYASGC